MEVGPRDGLQNEPVPVTTVTKFEFVRALVDAGLSEIELSSFVSPKWVPQLGDAAELWQMVKQDPTLQNARFSMLVPNRKGLERALECGVKRICVFTAASDEFTKRNINQTVEESLQNFAEVISDFRQATPDGWIRGYLSTAFDCPYAGAISPEKTAAIAERLIDLGVDEISIGDTIGVAVPREVRQLTEKLLKTIPAEKIAYHFHDTRGTALANVATAWELGISTFDSSAAGLGGCPYAKGAGGNLATEDLVYFFERSGVSTGIDLKKLAKASVPILELLGRPPMAKAQQASLSA
jgi:isopropylmalate/homocitrate/citramalate synthase